MAERTRTRGDGVGLPFVVVTLRPVAGGPHPPRQVYRPPPVPALAGAQPRGGHGPPPAGGEMRLEEADAPVHVAGGQEHLRHEDLSRPELLAHDAHGGGEAVVEGDWGRDALGHVGVDQPLDLGAVDAVHGLAYGGHVYEHTRTSRVV